MDLVLVKDISLVFIGAFVTFMFTLLVLKIQNKSAKLTWRKLSNLNIPANNLTGVNWIIENQGNKPSKDVKVCIKLKNNALFNTLDCVASERALEIKKSIDNKNSIATINIPLFPQNVSLDISALISNYSDDIEISLISEDAIGAEHKPNKSALKIRKYYTHFMVFIIITYLIWVVAAFGVLSLIFNEKIDFEQTKSIADLYLKSGDTKEALKLYKMFNENTIFTAVPLTEI